MGLIYLSDGTTRLDEESANRARLLACAALVDRHQLEYDKLVEEHMRLVLAQEINK